MATIPPPNLWPSQSVAAATDEPAAASDAPVVAAAGSTVPDGYVLVRKAMLEQLHNEILRIKGREALRERLPIFLSAKHLRRHA